MHTNRNPSLTQNDIEEFLAAYLGIRNVIWLRGGIAGDDTDGHIDDVARFCSPSTIVCALEEDTEDENYAILQENYRILCDATDQDGQPFRVVSLPMPRAVSDDEYRYPASYMNFYIGNKVVLVPVFGDPRDHKALDILSSLFPARKVIGVSARAMVEGFGTIHCATQQQPRGR
ncbi:MAG: agmatine deiminase family protein [Methanospirillum sp.]|nr:agmatine deiminase family protein [Methanospirillum sp.]